MWPAAAVPQIAAAFAEARTGRRATAEIEFERHDGQVVAYELVLNGVTDDSGRAAGSVVGIAVDVTARRRAVQALERGHQLTQLALEISARFLGMSSERVDSATREALRDISTRLGVGRAQLYDLSPDRTTFSLTYEWSVEARHSRFAELQAVPIANYSWMWTRLEADGVVAIPDVSQLPDEAAGDRARLTAFDVKAVLTLAVQRRGRVAGFFVLDVFEGPREWQADEIQALRIVADVLANAIVRKHAEEALRESEARFQKAFRNNPAAMAIIWLENQQIVEVNDAFARLLGYDPGQVIGRMPSEIGLTADDRVTTAMAEVLHGSGFVQDAEVWFPTGTGEVRHVSLSVDTFELAGERFALAVALDTTARTLAEEAASRTRGDLQQHQHRRAGRDHHD